MFFHHHSHSDFSIFIALFSMKANGECGEFLVCSIIFKSFIYEHIVCILDRLANLRQFKKYFLTQEGLKYVSQYLTDFIKGSLE